MNAETLLAAMLRVQRGGAATAWELCARLLADRPEEAPVACVALPGSTTAARLRRAVPAERLFCFPPLAALAPDELARRCATDPPAPPFLALGERDETWRRSHPLPWPAPAPAPDIVLRRLDTLLDARRPPGLLVIEAPEEAPAILRGARGLLAGPGAPAIVLDLAAAPAESRAALAAACGEALGADHTWHDALLMPFPDAPACAAMAAQCGEHAICALPRPAAPASLLDALRRTGWRCPVPPDPERGQAVSVPFDADLACAGFYPPESEGDTSWRWSGPGASAAFLLPWPGPGAWRLVLHVFNWGAAGSASDLRVLHDGRKLRLLDAGEGHAAYAGITLADDAPPAPLAIELVTPPPRRASDWDSRRLGINLTRCVLSPA